MEELIGLIKNHKDMRPLMEIQDVYKLLFQSILGLGHLLVNPEGAKKFLLEELNTLSKNKFQEALIEDISMRNDMVRINLRPFSERGMSPEMLFRAMLLTENANTSTVKDFIETWTLLIELVENGIINLNIIDLKRFNEKIIEMNYPVIHHSIIYNVNYQPAYRIIDRRIFEEIFN
ncbi:hypothetical protein [Alkaliphilus peptidifermentans]|uniref:Uncharacterized protein n=1 Tax=Alkaliphilus peptidifermentans DSM 18978 TaxID=1120976 RepID=A0A1G5HTC7_9FIRM|nr:hypothetical protein [Alkaliphilus peptidifermentans]SCY67007.1 hypothetical protein SAMN03080606_02128 [Alkaliphilus peptidifermentans DSM 18978]